MNDLKIYDQLEQGSDAWLQARCGVITASVIGDFLTPTLKVASNDTSRRRALSLAAERITGHVNETRMTDAMWRGVEDEPKARDWYREHHAPVDEIGFMTIDFHGMPIGASPDGLIASDGGLEIKSRDQRVQVETFLADAVPAYNLAQIHCCMWVSGRDWWDYVSYAEGLPVFLKRVHRDEKWIDALKAAATAAELSIREAVDGYSKRTHGMPVIPRTSPDSDEIW